MVPSHVVEHWVKRPHGRQALHLERRRAARGLLHRDALLDGDEGDHDGDVHAASRHERRREGFIHPESEDAKQYETVI